MDRDTAKSIVRANTLGWGVLGFLSLVPALFSVMMFDAPGSEKNPATIALALSIVTISGRIASTTRRIADVPAGTSGHFAHQVRRSSRVGCAHRLHKEFPPFALRFNTVGTARPTGPST